VRRLLVEESTPAGFGCFILVVAYGPGGAIQRQADDLGGGKTDRPAGQLALAAEPVEALQVGPHGRIVVQRLGVERDVDSPGSLGLRYRPGALARSGSGIAGASNG
jgi:hypothetical protein